MAEKVILLTNLGSPDSTEVRDVRTYLNEFLMDGRVIDVPYLLRLLLVKGIIVPFRAPKSAEKYKTIWTKEGSPLIVITNQLAEKLREASGLPVYVCMRYAHPSPEEAFSLIRDQHPDAKEIVLLPLYPHYAMSSYETAVEYVESIYRKMGLTYQLKIVKPFFDHPDYIKALTESIRQHLPKDYDHLLFSYHGIPERHVHKTDPNRNHCMKCEDCCHTASAAHAFCYRHQIIRTTELVAEQLDLKKEKHSFSFQSRLGQDKWLKPFSSEQFQAFPKQGIKKLVVVCPAFVSDCLETLEEIHVEGKEDFMKAGGEEFTVLPCLNTDNLWVKAIETLIAEA